MKKTKLVFRLVYLVLIAIGFWWLAWSVSRPVPKDYSDVKSAINLLMKGQEIDPSRREAVYEFLRRRYTGERGKALGLDFSEVIEKVRNDQRLNDVDKQQLSTMAEMFSKLSPPQRK